MRWQPHEAELPRKHSGLKAPLKLRRPVTMEIGHLLEAVSNGKERGILIKIADEGETRWCSWASDIIVDVFVYFRRRRSISIAKPVRNNHCRMSGKVGCVQLRTGI